MKGDSYNGQAFARITNVSLATFMILDDLIMTLCDLIMGKNEFTIHTNKKAKGVLLSEVTHVKLQNKFILI